MADQEIKLTVKVNAETGQLEVLGNEFKKTAQSTNVMADAWRAFGPALTASGILLFFKNAVQMAEEENESLRRLKFTLEANKQSWDLNSKSVLDWANAVQRATRFSDGDALKSLDQLARATGNVRQAQSAANLAMNLSVVSGKNLSETTELVNGLINKQERAVTLAAREFGTYAQGATTAQGVLDALQKTTANAATAEESLTKTSAITKNEFEDFSKQIGKTFLPALEVVTRSLTILLKLFDNFGTLVASNVATAMHAFQGLAEFLTSSPREWGRIFRETFTNLKSDAIETTDAIVEVWKQGNDEIDKKSLESANQRLQTKDALTKEELRQQQEANQKLAEMELDLDQKMAGLGEQTLQKKRAILAAEVKLKEEAIRKEVKAGADGTAALVKLEQYRVARDGELAKADLFVKQQLWYEATSTAINALQVINSMGDKSSSAERLRAKALLALQQSVTIGWIWVSAAKAAAETPGGILASPAIFALAAAQSALAVAQFAQQSQAIDRSGAGARTSLGTVDIGQSLPGVSPGASGPNFGGGTGVSIGGGGTLGSSGGGGGGTVINVGGVVVNFSTDNLSIDNVDVVMMKMSEKARQATIEAVQLALNFNTLATKNAGIAS